MSEIEEKLYDLMEIAGQQQQAVKDALIGLKKQQGDLTETTVQLQNIVSQKLIPAAENAANKGATEAVNTALENASQTAVDAVAKSCEPLLAGMAGVATQAADAERKFKGAVKWLGWRMAGVGFCAILAVALIAWGMIWWQRVQLADLKAEREKITAEVAEAQSTLAVLEKRTGGVHYGEGREGRFILVRKGFEVLNCINDTPCIRLK